MYNTPQTSIPLFSNSQIIAAVAGGVGADVGVGAGVASYGFHSWYISQLVYITVTIQKLGNDLAGGQYKIR